MRMTGIPVKHYGVVIGTASVADDGKIIMDLPDSHDFGDVLAESIKNGTVTGLEIRPIMPPSVAAEKPNKGPIDAIGYNNVTGVQFGDKNTQYNRF